MVKISYRNISEGYFKNPEQIKQDIEKNKTISKVDKLAQTSRKILVTKNLRKLNVDNVKYKLKQALDAYKHPCPTNALFYTINTAYFYLHLVNEYDLVSVQEYYVNIELIYTGKIEIVRERESISLDRGEFGCVRMKQQRWPNPDIWILERDLNVIRKFLEHNFPGIFFKLQFSVREADDTGLMYLDDTGKKYTLLQTESVWSEILKSKNVVEDEN